MTVKGVVLDGRGAVLLARNDRREWELPGGRPEAGESLDIALAREIAEETGLDVAVGALIAAWRFEVVPGRWVRVIAYGCTPRDARAPRVSAEHDAVRFVPLAALDGLRLPAGYRAAIDRRVAAVN